jgi:hypothetical protein
MTTVRGPLGSSEADWGAFPLRVCLSLISVIAAISRLTWVVTRKNGHFSLLSGKIWETLASGTAMAASVLLLIVVLSKSGLRNSTSFLASHPKLTIPDNHLYQVIYIDVLVINIFMVGVFEVLGHL